MGQMKKAAQMEKYNDKAVGLLLKARALKLSGEGLTFSAAIQRAVSEWIKDKPQEKTMLPHVTPRIKHLRKTNAIGALLG